MDMLSVSIPAKEEVGQGAEQATISSSSRTFENRTSLDITESNKIDVEEAVQLVPAGREEQEDRDDLKPSCMS